MKGNYYIMNVINVFTRLGNKAIEKLSEVSPTTLVVGGIAVGIGAAVVACKETKKAEPIIAEAKEHLATIDEAKKAGVTAYREVYTKHDYAKDLFKQYSSTGVKLVKVYWPALALGSLSVTMILAGHHIISKRYVAAVGAYKALSDTFEDYRKRVADKYGEEEEKNLRYNLTDEVIHEADQENGVTSERKVKKQLGNYAVGTERIFHGDKYDENGHLIERGTAGFDSGLNGTINNARFLEIKEQYCNDLLKAKGYLSLNRVYEELGFEATEEGQLNGWRYDPNQTHQVTFGLNNLLNDQTRDFMLGQANDILLTFNCYPIVNLRKSHGFRAKMGLNGAEVNPNDTELMDLQ